MRQVRSRGAARDLERAALFPFNAHDSRRGLLLALGVVLVLWLGAGCSVDKGLEPLRSGIEGTVVFHGEPPPQTEKIVVVAAYAFPPAGPADLAFSDPLPLDSDTVQFRLVLPPGDYPLVAVLWKQIGYAYDVWNVFGAYFRHPGDFMPAVVTVPDRRTVVSGITIHADFSRLQPHSESVVTGTIRYRGTPPPELEELRLVASLRFPPRNILDFRIGATLPTAGDGVNYVFPLPPGRYAMLAAVAKLKGEDWNPQNIVGLYTGDDPLQPGEVEVPTPEATVGNIDFDVDFSRIRRTTDSGVHGVVRFLGSPSPEVTEGILVASRTYPPATLLDVIIGPSVPIAGDSARFRFQLSPGRYEFLGLLLPSPSGQLDITSIAAYYRDPSDSLRPGAIEISDETSWVGPVELKVDFNRGAIEGVVHFIGPWPTNTEFVRVAAFDIVPQSLQDYYRVKGFTDPLPMGVAEAPYHLDLPPGTYRYIVVVWKAMGTSLLDIKQIGLYTAPGDTTQPGVVEVRPGTVTTGIDIRADFTGLSPLLSADRPGDSRATFGEER